MSNFSALIATIQANIKTNGNEEITGAVLQDVLEAIVQVLGTEAINDLETALSNEIGNRQNADTALGNAIGAIEDAIENGYVYAGIATPSGTPASGKVFYLAVTAGTYTNFGGLVVTQGINILKNNGTAWSQEQFIALDNTPMPSSSGLVKSGGVFEEIMTNGSAFDLTVHNSGTTYADLSAALTAMDSLPAAYKKGGMSIKFVQTSDNKYVQFRYMSTSTANADFTNVSNWQGVDDEPTAGSNNLVKSGGIYLSLNQIMSDYGGVDGYQISQYNSGAPITTSGGHIRVYKTLGGKSVKVFGSVKTLSNNIAVIAKTTGGSYGSFVNYNPILILYSAGESAINQDITLNDNEWLLLSTFDGYSLDVYDDKFEILDDKIEANSESISNIEDRIIETNTPDYGIDDIVNGNKKIYSLIDNFINEDKGKVTINELYNKFSYSYSGSGNQYIRTALFNPVSQDLVHVKFSVKNFSKSGGAAGFVIMVSDSTNINGTRINLGYVTANGSYDFTFDAANLSVYSGFTNFCIWINNVTSGSGTLSADFYDFEVFEVVNQHSFNHISGSNSLQLLSSIDNKLGDIGDIGAIILTSPNGGKYIMNVKSDGTLAMIPLFVSKAAFTGNSLLKGFGFGMAASASNKDYYALLTSFLLSKNAQFTSTKGTSLVLENVTSVSNIQSAITTFLNQTVDGTPTGAEVISSDDELVVIQLGDNVQDESVFAQLMPEALKQTRQKCTNARVVVMGMWYPTDTKYDILKDACKKTGCDFLDFIGIPNSTTRSAIGNISHQTTQERTIENVVSVTEVTSTKITVTFEVSNVQYSSTINVSSYSLSGTTLTYTSDEYVITSAAVATHPNDEGFRQISNRFLYRLGYVDDEEYFD